eukprot:scaffold11791_cov45-Phaeocystis_antarctica.AAC.1
MRGEGAPVVLLLVVPRTLLELDLLRVAHGHLREHLLAHLHLGEGEGSVVSGEWGRVKAAAAHLGLRLLDLVRLHHAHLVGVRVRVRGQGSSSSRPPVVPWRRAPGPASRAASRAPSPARGSGR